MDLLIGEILGRPHAMLLPEVNEVVLCLPAANFKQKSSLRGKGRFWQDSRLFPPKSQLQICGSLKYRVTPLHRI